MKMHWVIISTGSTQTFIFDSNVRKLNVGASYLVTRLPRWVDDAIETLDPLLRGTVETVVNVSGLAHLLVSRREVGHEIIGSVTRLALEEAPGLLVWGSVSEPFEEAGQAAALEAEFKLNDETRAELPSTSARFPGLPFTERCRWTGLPASTVVSSGPHERRGTPISAVAAKKWEVSWGALEAIGADEEHTDADLLKSAIVPHENLNMQLGKSKARPDTWLALVHADGNGVGQLLRTLRELGGDKFSSELRDVSRTLDDAAKGAAQRAVIETAKEDLDHKNWILPLVVGGDDFTALMHPSRVRGFIERYLLAFQAMTGTETLKALSELAHSGSVDDEAPAHLTASAGIAIVKPTHPFHAAYRLCEELCQSAKVVKTRAVGHSSYDIQVFHESVGRRTSDVRAHLGTDSGFPLHPGPLLVGEAGSESAEKMSSHTVLTGLIDSLADGVMTSSEWHRLRSRLTELGNEDDRATGYARAVEALLARVSLLDPSRLRRLKAVLKPDDAPNSHAPYLITAMDLLDVEAA